MFGQVRALREQVESLQSGFAGAKAEIEAAKKQKDKVLQLFHLKYALNIQTSRLQDPPFPPLCCVGGVFWCVERQGSRCPGGGEREAQRPYRGGENQLSEKGGHITLYFLHSKLGGSLRPSDMQSLTQLATCGPTERETECSHVLASCGQVETNARRLEQDLVRMRGDLNDALRAEQRLKDKLKVGRQANRT
jgi:hypothetical protein